MLRIPASAGPRAHDSRALLGVYVRTSAWYVGLFAALWMLGIEAIPGHLTPFYARIAPAFGATPKTLWVMGGDTSAQRRQSLPDPICIPSEHKKTYENGHPPVWAGGLVTRRWRQIAIGTTPPASRRTGWLV